MRVFISVIDTHIDNVHVSFTARRPECCESRLDRSVVFWAQQNSVVILYTTKFNIQQERQGMYNITPRNVRVTVVAMEKQ